MDAVSELRTIVEEQRQIIELLQRCINEHEDRLIALEEYRQKIEGI